MKIALVHDFLTRFGGAEQVLKELIRMYPGAPIFTLLADKKFTDEFFPGVKIETSFVQKFPMFLRKRVKYLAPIFCVAVESFDLSDFDLVISSSSAFAKGVILKPRTIHVSYCHSPMRYVWDYSFDYLKDQKPGFFKSKLIKLASHYLRLWDFSASQRVDFFIANSKSTQARISKYYQKSVPVVYPPVTMASFGDFKNDVQDYFLIVSQLTPYKKIDLAVEAFNKLKLPLIIVGDGPERERLQRLAESNIMFLGWQTQEAIQGYYKRCLAFLMPGEDDFGIAMVEAMSYGKPVLAFKKGGAEEIILEGMTGEFFQAPLPEILADGVRRLKENYANYSPLVIRKRAEKFSEEKFREELIDAVSRCLKPQNSEQQFRI